MASKRTNSNEPNFFARKRPSQVDIAGFWNREQESSFVGVLVKHVPNAKDPKHARPFYIFKVTSGSPMLNVKGKDNRPAINQEYIGVAANWSLTSVIDNVVDIGKLMRLTVTGTAPNPNGGKEMVLIDVGVNEPQTEDEPF